METHYDNKEIVTDSVSLITTILVRYPEVSTINFNPSDKSLKLKFMFLDTYIKSELDAIEIYLKEIIETYSFLEKRDPNILQVNAYGIENITIIEIERDIASLTQTEITLIVQSFYQYGKKFILEEAELNEEDIEFQEEFIETMLESVKVSKQDKHLFAFREEDRVIVFNK